MNVVPDGITVGYFIEEGGHLVEVTGPDRINEFMADENRPYQVYWSLDAVKDHFLGQHRLVVGYDQFGKEVEDAESLKRADAAYEEAIAGMEAVA